MWWVPGFVGEVLNHYIIHLKLSLHCVLTNWNSNKNLGGKKEWRWCHEKDKMKCLIIFSGIYVNETKPLLLAKSIYHWVWGWIASEENVNENNFYRCLIQRSTNITGVDYSPHQSALIHVTSDFWKSYQTNM